MRFSLRRPFAAALALHLGAGAPSSALAQAINSSLPGNLAAAVPAIVPVAAPVLPVSDRNGMPVSGQIGTPTPLANDPLQLLSPSFLPLPRRLQEEPAVRIEVPTQPRQKPGSRLATQRQLLGPGFRRDDGLTGWGRNDGDDRGSLPSGERAWKLWKALRGMTDHLRKNPDAAVLDGSFDASFGDERPASVDPEPYLREPPALPPAEISTPPSKEAGLPGESPINAAPLSSVRLWSQAHPMSVSEGLLHIGDFTFPVSKKVPVEKTGFARLWDALLRRIGLRTLPADAQALGITEKEWKAVNLPTNKKAIYETLKAFTLNQHVLYVGETGG
ncbi:MAG: hypothetical protein WCU88_13765, partial [Elusimicrobiota bacterium]